MSSTRVRVAVVLGSVPVLLAAAIGPAQAAPQPTPRPASPQPASQRSLPEGPWPPSEVLAADPRSVGLAPTAAAAALATPCPASSPGVHSFAPATTGAARTVALTFDDGPGVTTQAILTILQRYNVPATFFNIGLNSTVRPTLVRSEVTAGYAVGNHTWDHPELPTLTASGQASEMDRASTEQKNLVAVAPCLFRPPYGEYDSTTLAVAQQRRMTVWNWSVDTEDWKAGTSTATSWVDRIVSRAIAGGSQAHPVVLMHNPPAGIPATVTALPRIIEYYSAHGYRFVDLLGRTGAASAPAAATTAAGLHLLVRDGTGTVAGRTLRGSVWSGWTGLGGPVTGGPAAAADGPASLVATAIGTNNWVYRQTVPDPGPATGWSSLNGIATSKAGVATGPDGVVSVVIRGGNGQAYLRQRVGGQWTPAWQSLGGLLDPVAPGVAATAAGVLAVGCIGTDHAFYVKTRTPAGVWSTSWHRIGGGINSDVALSPTADGSRLVAVVRGGGMNGYVSVSNADATSWSAWTNIGGGLASAPTVTVNGNALEVFVVGFTNRLYRKTATDGTAVTGWTPAWQQLP
ncbi:MAG TPA: polysaccharide deacetylase family protein [Mycobacteriales bacterium]|nr:polysaccharide deacetylase family protein [Mycobacteriales bacterium]